jgi:hypothetical protein
MRHFLWTPLVALALIGACDRSQPPPRTLQVGSHSIQVTIPDGWEHLDYGDKHQLRRGQHRISIEEMDSLGPTLESGSKRALVELREAERRDVASRRFFEVGGRSAVTIDTWDHLSHQWRKRFVFVDDGGRYLAMYTMLGQFETMETAFDSLVTSLAFTDSLPTVR